MPLHEDDGVVDRRRVSVRIRRLARAHLDRERRPLVCIETETGELLVGREEVRLVVIGVLRPRRAGGMRGDEQVPAGGDETGRGPQDLARGSSTGECRKLAVTRSYCGATSREARSFAANEARSSASPAACAASRARPIAEGEISIPVAVHPCWASQMTSAPSPHPRSSDLPGASSEATSATTRLTRPDHT